jgi:hypothetical protein
VFFAVWVYFLSFRNQLVVVMAEGRRVSGGGGTLVPVMVLVLAGVVGAFCTCS